VEVRARLNMVVKECFEVNEWKEGRKEREGDSESENVTSKKIVGDEFSKSLLLCSLHQPSQEQLTAY
jgi:hypothetical protein